MEKRNNISLIVGLMLTFGSADDILLREAKTRLDLVNLSLAIWSGLVDSLGWCSSLCAAEPKCVSLLFNNAEKSCKIFNLLHTLDDSTEETDLKYYTIERASNRRLPESCADLANCSGTNTDGEYWLYPKATSGKRVKVYCHNMGTNPTEYITLKYNNIFVQHTCSNWIVPYEECQIDYKPPLKKANFDKIAINIQDLSVHRTDYTFAMLTGNFSLRFGETTDCSGHADRLNCHFFGNAVINTRGTGMIIDQNIQWGVLKNYYTAIQNFTRSKDGSEISFKCGGWWGGCGPLPIHINVVLTSEFVPDIEAQSEVCIM